MVTETRDNISVINNQSITSFVRVYTVGALAVSGPGETQAPLWGGQVGTIPPAGCDSWLLALSRRTGFPGVTADIKP